MVLFTRGRLSAGTATGLLVAVLGGTAWAQAPGPVNTGGSNYRVNADVDTYFAIGLGGLVEPGAGVNSGVSSNSINDETYVTLLLPNLNGGVFANADFNIYSDPANNGTGPFSFKQPGFNANLLVATGAAVNQGETDDNQSYNIGSSNTTNNYTNSVENNLTYTQIEHNFFQPTGNGSNHYGFSGPVSISSSAAGAAGQAPLTTFLNTAEKSYSASAAPVYVTFTFNSDMSLSGDTTSSSGKLSAYAVDGLTNPQGDNSTPEFLSYTLVPAATPEPAAWTTFGLGVAGVAGRLLARKRKARQG